MNSTLLILILVVCPLAGNFFADWSMFAERISRWVFYRRYSIDTSYNPAFIRGKIVRLVLQAISCPMCLSGHLTWITLLILGQFNIWVLIVCTMAASGSGMIINKISNKL